MQPIFNLLFPIKTQIYMYTYTFCNELVTLYKPAHMPNCCVIKEQMD